MDYISTETLATRLELTVACLEKWRREGTGPKWSRLGGAVRYNVCDVERWLTEQANASEREARERRLAR